VDGGARVTRATPQDRRTAGPAPSRGLEAETLLAGIAELVTPDGPGPHRGPEQGRTLRIPDAAVAIACGRVAWVGPAAAWRGSAVRVVDLGGRAVVPGLVDPHTHLL
jgi:imidazolonepropionase